MTEPIPRDELEEHLALLKRLLINFPRNRGFLGREVELARLHAASSGSGLGFGSGPVGIRPAGSARAAGLIGMGGIGKTQLAVEYSYRQHEADTYPDGIYWINAAESLDQGFARLAPTWASPKPTRRSTSKSARPSMHSAGGKRHCSFLITSRTRES